MYLFSHIRRFFLYKSFPTFKKCIIRSFCKDFLNYNNQITFSSPIILKYLKNLQNEYESLNKQTKLNEIHILRLQHLKTIVDIVNEHAQILENIKSLKEISKNASEDLNKLISEENATYRADITRLEHKLKKALLCNYEDVYKGVLFEITAGVGGQEAMLFARNLYEMYLNYIHYKRWDYVLANLDSSDIGGIRHASILINGADVYSYLNVEAGVHRVQRVPTTEKSGRIHTSTVAIVVIPQPLEIDVIVKPSDLKIETKRASGAGGQHVNTTDSAVRIIHLPTGITVECQTERSQMKNKEIALEKLKAQLYQKQLDEQRTISDTTRKTQVKSSLRSEKIRTYNFTQHRISDHRIHENIYNLSRFLEGNEILDDLIVKLRYYRQMNLLMDNLKQYE